MQFWNSLWLFVIHDPMRSLVTIVCVGLASLALFFRYKARKYHGQYLSLYYGLQDQNSKKEWYKQNAITDEDNQIKAVTEYDNFVRQRIFNTEETKVFYLVKDILKRQEFQGWHVHGQVSLGQIIKTDINDAGDYQADRAHQSINSKRADMVVTDNFGSPVAIIEYFGGGHWGTDRAKTQKRDAVKRIVAEKAGIKLVEILSDTKMNHATRYELLHSAFMEHRAQNGRKPLA